MANHVVPSGHVGVHEIALAAGVESTVTFASDVPTVEVAVLTGDAPVYFRFGTGAATVKGTDCWSAQPGTTAMVNVPTSGNTIARLISAGAAVVSVARG